MVQGVSRGLLIIGVRAVHATSKIVAAATLAIALTEANPVDSKRAWVRTKLS